MTASVSQESAPIIVVGAGPVGLFQALSLHLRGIDCVVIDKRHTSISDTRSLGIHPPCLDMLDELGLLNQFLKKVFGLIKELHTMEEKSLERLIFLVPNNLNISIRIF